MGFQQAIYGDLTTGLRGKAMFQIDRKLLSISVYTYIHSSYTFMVLLCRKYRYMYVANIARIYTHTIHLHIHSIAVYS